MDHLNQQPYSSTSSAVIPHPNGSLTSNEPYYAVGSRYGLDGANDSDAENGLIEYWHILRRRKKTVLYAALGGLVLGFVVGIPMKPMYRAQVSVEVLNLNEDFMNMRQANPVTTTDNSFETSEEQTQAKLLEGGALVKRVFDKLDPGNSLSKKRPMAKSGWRSWLHLPEHVELSQREKMLNKAADSLKVKATPHTRVVELSVDSRDPRFAADFANTLVQEFIQQNLEARLSTTDKTGEWLRREIEDARIKLRNSENALQSYARQSGLVFTDDNTNVATEKLQQVQQELSTATADRIAKEARFELSKDSPPDSLADVLADQGLQDTTSKLNDLRQRVSSLSAVFNPGYKKLQEAQAELATMQAVFDHNRDEILRRIQNDYQQAARNEKLLADAYGSQIREVSGQSEKAIQYNILKREVDSSRQLYDTILQETKQASIASAMRASNVRVFDPADPPDRPVYPDFRLNSGLGLFLGLLLGVAFVTVGERMDRTLRQPGDLKLWADLAELGTIPSASTAKLAYGKKVESRLNGRAEMLPNGSVDLREKTQSVELITWQHKPSIVAEAFRSTLTSIFFTGENGNRPRVLVFTSASPKDGKTTVVSNLAIATAEINCKVLIIDADMRRPRMHDVFGLPNERGLSDLLGEEFSEQRLSALVQETRVPGLHVMTAGQAVQASAHLLYSPNFAALLGKLRKEYDLILIDTPPMLQMVDARVAGRLADAVVLVARAGLTTRDALLALKGRFADDRIRVLGTILNNWNPKTSHTAYYSGLYGNSYYGSQVKKEV